MVVYPMEGGLPVYFATEDVPWSTFVPGNYGIR
jgi:hypothetical protein